MGPQHNFNFDEPLYQSLRLSILAFSFLSLAAFGSYLLAKDEVAHRVMFLIPLGLEAIWVFGLLNMRGDYPPLELRQISDVWTRYAIGVPASLLAAAGLIYQPRAFRRSGLIRFGQDALWAAIAFGWYGLVGQTFVAKTALPPSTFLNADLFLSTIGVPVQIFRALTAILAAFFVIRFLRAFQVEAERQIAALQAARLEEARQHEALHGELYRSVVAAQESERQRIARDLHDETGQALTAIGLGLRGLSAAIQHGKNDQAADTLRQLEGMTANSLTELQHLISDLRPSHIDDLGLPAALRWYAGALQERTKLRVSVETLGAERELDPALKIAIFRVTQEALNNVVKHANAYSVDIRLAYEENGLTLRVKDDGRGFDPRASHKNEGRVSLGLIGMQERAGLLGGTCAIISTPGRGALVEVRAPYHRQENAQ
jgi:signal transduction histidine kinase